MSDELTMRPKGEWSLICTVHNLRKLAKGQRTR